MGLIIDTCVFIHAERKTGALECTQWQNEKVFISTITVSELLVGVHHATTQTRRVKRTAFVETILSTIPTLDFTTEIARIHSELYAYLAKKGCLIGAHDLIIAATAVAYGYSLLTTNEREFKRINGLEVISY